MLKFSSQIAKAQYKDHLVGQLSSEKVAHRHIALLYFSVLWMLKYSSQIAKVQYKDQSNLLVVRKCIVNVIR